MRRCTSCGEENPENAKFCPDCGAAIELQKAVDPIIGALLKETYRVDKRIGSGGMARVYQATHEVLRKPYAIKVLHPDLANDPEALGRFVVEARAAASLSHPGVVEITDFGKTDDDVPFHVMELLEGEDLDRLISREGVLDVSHAMMITVQVASVLEAAHEKGITHRDIKPSNIFLTKTYSGEEQAKIGDFGIALLRDSPRLTEEGSSVGTPWYMSPEQAKGLRDIDLRTDIYSLGATLFNLVCGRPPFEGKNYLGVLVQHIRDDPPHPSTLRPELPSDLERLILDMLEKDTSSRPQSMREVRDRLYEMQQESEERTEETELHILAEDEARQLESKHALLRTLRSQGTMATSSGSHWNALEPLREALELAQEMDLPEIEAELLSTLGFVECEIGDDAAALRDLESALKLAVTSGNEQMRASVLNKLGWVLWKLGDIIAAKDAEDIALRISRTIGLKEVELVSQVYLSIFDLGLGNPDHATERARKVCGTAEETGYDEQVVHALMVIALERYLSGSTNDAAKTTMKYIEKYRTASTTVQFEVELHLIAAMCLAAVNHLEDADLSLEAAEKSMATKAASVTEPDAAERMFQNIGKGLPPQVQEVIRELCPRPEPRSKISP